MRARSLKPALFMNEHLAVSDPINTLIFAGLWCAADREGKLEDRPARIHLEVNPGRAFQMTEDALEWLEKHEFIVRYTVAGKKYIYIPTFLKHQRPHQNEKPSEIPYPESTTKVTSASHQGTKHFALTPDSGLLTADSGPLTTTLRSSSSELLSSSSSERGNSDVLQKRESRKTALRSVVASLADAKAMP